MNNNPFLHLLVWLSGEVKSVVDGVAAAGAFAVGCLSGSRGKDERANTVVAFLALSSFVACVSTSPR